MDADKNIIENLNLQLQEVEMLQAMFPGKKEVVFDDPTLLMDVEEYVNSSGKTPNYLRYISFDMNLDVLVCEPDKKICLRIAISLPSNYPDVYPNVSIISNELSRAGLSQLNENLMNYMSKLEHGEVLLLSLITWLQENVTTYYVPSDTDGNNKSESVEEEEEMVSMWLYMHHIYNKEKRKNIINWAAELDLTGFSLPGKPGVVNVEGFSRNIDEYFNRLRRLSWQRMSCKVKEKCEKRIFSNFEELTFEVHGTRENHMDMGQFFSYLKERELGHMFRELFGVEGHS